MMNFISPPTDSLHKFIAISGLFSLIGGLVFMVTSSESAFEQRNISLGKQRILEKKIQLMTEKMNYEIQEIAEHDSIVCGLSKQASPIDSISSRLLFRLPKPLQKTINELILKREALINQQSLSEYYRDRAASYELYYDILIFGGEIAAILGFVWWYNLHTSMSKLEKEKLTSELNGFLSEDRWQTYCQSCVRTLHLTRDRGTEEDGSICRTYCLHCYRQGVFTEPDLSYEEAIRRLLKECKKRNYGWFQTRSEKIILKNSMRWINRW